MFTNLAIQRGLTFAMFDKQRVHALCFWKTFLLCLILDSSSRMPDWSLQIQSTVRFGRWIVQPPAKLGHYMSFSMVSTATLVPNPYVYPENNMYSYVFVYVHITVK
jgi:hypothetical protein